MPLFDILTRIASSKGFKPFTNPSERSNLVAKINQAALELYTATDLENSLMENVYDIDVENPQVTLPATVGWIRGCRYTDARIKVELNSIYPRYHHGGFHRETWPLRFRELPTRPLYQDITNQSQLILSIPEINGSSFTVVIIGNNSNSQNIKEEVTFSAFDLEKTTTTVFNEVTTIFKSVRTKSDITIKDVDGNTLAVFPNYETDLKHIPLQISDAWTAPYGIWPIEILYKMRYVPMEEDWDVFQCGSQYDNNIYWKFRELYAVDKELDSDKVLAIASAKEKELRKNIDEQRNEGLTNRLNFAPNSVYKVFSGLRLRKYLKKW